MKARELSHKFDLLSPESESFFTDLDLLSNEIQLRVAELQAEKVKRLYPRQSNPDESIKKIGLIEESNALAFLNSSQSYGAIKDTIINGAECGKTDFVSTIFSKLVQQIPEDDPGWIKVYNNNIEKYQFLKFLKGLYAHWLDRRGVNEINDEMDSINKLSKKLNTYLQEEERGTK